MCQLEIRLLVSPLAQVVIETYIEKELFSLYHQGELIVGSKIVFRAFSFCFQITVSGLAIRKINSANRYFLFCFLHWGRCWEYNHVPFLMEFEIL